MTEKRESRVRVSGKNTAVHYGTKRQNRTKNKVKIKLNIKRLAAMAAALTFCTYFVCVTVSQQHTMHNKNKEINELNSRISAAESETEQLQEEYGSVNEPEYLERVAREKLGLVQPNERVFIDANQAK